MNEALLSPAEIPNTLRFERSNLAHSRPVRLAPGERSAVRRRFPANGPWNLASSRRTSCARGLARCRSCDFGLVFRLAGSKSDLPGGRVPKSLYGPRFGHGSIIELLH